MIDKKFINDMREKARQDVIIFNADEKNRALLKEEGKDEILGYNGSTFLYMRAFPKDDGIRPVSHVSWDSPDIKIFDSNGVCIDPRLISLNMAYLVKVAVYNAGDLDCHSCQLEFYLHAPSLKYVVSTSMLIGSKIVSVPAKSKSIVEFPFTASEGMVGHKFLLVRIFCITTNDCPSDWINLDVYNDRHVGIYRFKKVPG